MRRTDLNYDVTRVYTSLTPLDPDIVPPSLGTVFKTADGKAFRFVVNNHSAALTIGDVVALDKTALYPNAVTQSGTDSAGYTALAALTDVALSDGSGFVLATKSTHGLVTGQKVVISGTAGGTYAGTYTIRRINADTFELVGSTYSADKTAVATPVAATIMGGVAQGFIPAGGYGWIQFAGVGTATVDGDTVDIVVGDELCLVDSAFSVVKKTALAAVATFYNHLRARIAATLTPSYASVALTNSSGKVLATSNGHGLVDGDVVRVIGATGEYDGLWTVADDETNTFTLKGAVYVANVTATIVHVYADNVAINCRVY